MQIKNKISLIISCTIYLLICVFGAAADEFNISAIEISVDKENNIVVGKGSVEFIDDVGKIIKGDKVVYEKTIEFLTIEG